MKPSQIINRAVLLLETGDALVRAKPPPGGQIKGWCQGGIKDDLFQQCRDADGQLVRLFLGGADKSIPNESAVQYSAYAAIAKVLADRDTKPEQLPLMWDTLWDMALAEPSVVHLGGTNPEHPLIAFNEVPGRRADEVVGFLNAVAAHLELIEGSPAKRAERDYAAVPAKHGPKAGKGVLPRAAKPAAPPAAKKRAKRSKVVRASPPAKPKGRKLAKPRKPPTRKARRRP